VPSQQPPSQVPGLDARRARRSPSAAYWGGPRPMKARNDAELGEQIRHALWKFAGRSRLPGVRRDQAAVALVRNRYPAARDVFSDQAIAAAIREVTDGTCHFCALRVLTAAADTAMPPSPPPASWPCSVSHAPVARASLPSRNPSRSSAVCWPRAAARSPAATPARSQPGPSGRPGRRRRPPTTPPTRGAYRGSSHARP
jgi:hypothetical protein